MRAGGRARGAGVWGRGELELEALLTGWLLVLMGYELAGDDAAPGKDQFDVHLWR